MDLGLTGDEHAALCGLPKTRKSTKELVARYNLMESERSKLYESTVIKETEIPTKADDEKPSKGQRTLF